MEPSLEDSVLLEQVDDSGQLLTLDPIGDGDDEECPELDRRAHDGFYLALPIKAETRLSKMPRLTRVLVSFLFLDTTRSAYERWWEARKIWGGIVNDSRALARQVLCLLTPLEEKPESREQVEDLHKEMIYRQLVWNVALNFSLRDKDPMPEMQRWLSATDMERIGSFSSKQNALLQIQTERLAHAHRRGYIDRILVVPVQDTLQRFSDYMAMCERIKKTVFPTHYSYFISRIIWLFYLLLPFGVAQHLTWAAVPVTVIVSQVFVMLEAIGRYLQSPFENNPTDTPMDATCRTIEIDLRQQLGETQVPEPLQPVDGVLM